jgi:N6-L-threonylcarbamoyladenine synthase
MESLTSIQLLGSTRDDSVGEAYDKTARLLGLGYPGGPAVDKLAKTGTDSIPFPRPMLNEGFEFSFSGLKSAVGRFIEKNPEVEHADVAASFVSACMEILLTKCRRHIRRSVWSWLVAWRRVRNCVKAPRSSATVWE